MKPGSEYFHRIIELLGCSAEQVVFIDDNKVNVKAAADVGINAQVYHLNEGPERMLEILQHYDIPGV